MAMVVANEREGPCPQRRPEPGVLAQSLGYEPPAGLRIGCQKALTRLDEECPENLIQTGGG